MSDDLIKLHEGATKPALTTKVWIFVLLTRNKIAGISEDMARFCGDAQQAQRPLAVQVEVLKCPLTFRSSFTPTEAIGMPILPAILTGLYLFFATALTPAADIPSSSKYLVLDSRIIEKTDGVALRLGKVEKDIHNPLFAEKSPGRSASTICTPTLCSIEKRESTSVGTAHLSSTRPHQPPLRRSRSG